MKFKSCYILALSLMIIGCGGSNSSTNCGNGVIDPGEECDGTNLGEFTTSCSSVFDFYTGPLSCDDTCSLNMDNCREVVCNHNGIKEQDEDCDGEDFGDLTCEKIDSEKTFGHLGCTKNCQVVNQFCGKADLGLQAPNPDSEQTDQLCSDGLNNFNNRDERTGKSFIDCDNHACITSPLVQICHGTENSDDTCSDKIDNPTSSNLPAALKSKTNGLIDCADPSCFKNWRVTVCSEQAPKWELGEDCKDGVDNDGDGMADCEDPDCLHVGMSNCPLNGKTRVLFDNAHHQIAGAVDWIVDITGRHPYPSKPSVETEWHGSLSSLAKDLLDSGQFVIENLPQDRQLIYDDDSPQFPHDEDLPQKIKNYKIVVSVEPSSRYSNEEILSLYRFVKYGGSLLLFANHKTADRDANQVDAVTAINWMLSRFPDTISLENNHFGFYVLDNSSMDNGTATVVEGAENHPVISGPAGTVSKADYFGGTGFVITDNTIAKSLMKTDSGMDYVVAVEYEQGRVVIIGDSAITGDGTNFLGINTGKNAYQDNKTLILNAFYWLQHKD